MKVFEDPASLSRRLRLSLEELNRLAAESQSAYETRRAWVGTKERTLRVPRGPVRRAQDRLARLLGSIPSHPAAYCVTGKGAVAAAAKHHHHPYLLHIDIADFFPSVRPERVRATFIRLGASENLALVITQLVTYDDQLPQGAPTSVAVANLVLYPLDVRVASLCKRHGLTYTRYVDDLAVSGGRRIEWIKKVIGRIVRDDGWNTGRKGGLSGPNDSKRYLGIVLNAQPNVDRQYVKDLKGVLRHARKLNLTINAPTSRRVGGRIQYVRDVNEAVGNGLREQLASLKTLPSSQA